MRFAREIFLNTSQDCEWLRTTHLKGLAPPAFESFVLVGSEDCPSALRLYASRKPEYNEHEVVEYKQNDAGELAGPPRVATKVIRRRTRGA